MRTFTCSRSANFGLVLHQGHRTLGWNASVCPIIARFNFCISTERTDSDENNIIAGFSAFSFKPRSLQYIHSHTLEVSVDLLGSNICICRINVMCRPYNLICDKIWMTKLNGQYVLEIMWDLATSPVAPLIQQG